LKVCPIKSIEKRIECLGDICKNLSDSPKSETFSTMLVSATGGNDGHLFQLLFFLVDNAILVARIGVLVSHLWFNLWLRAYINAS